MRPKQSILLAILTLVCVLAFQNCSSSSNRVSFSESGSGKLIDETEGTGAQPYDGKVFVLTGALCPDGTPIRARVIVKSATAASLVREECQDINPIELSSSEFQLDPVDSNKMYLRSQALVMENVVNTSTATPTSGFGYWVWQDFGTPPDTAANTSRSILRVFENGIEIGPAHSLSAEIEQIGGGRFVHWDGGQGPALLFSATDNTDPRVNGRRYTYIVGQ